MPFGLRQKKEEGGRPRLLSPFRLRQAEPAFDAIEAAFHPVEPAVEPFDGPLKPFDAPRPVGEWPAWVSGPKLAGWRLLTVIIQRWDIIVIFIHRQIPLLDVSFTVYGGKAEAD